MRAARLVLLAAAALAALFGSAAAQVRGGPPKVHPRVEDVPYIKCQVCELLAKNAWKQVKEMQKAATPSKPLSEEKIIEKMEKITTAWRVEGEWISKLDLVEQGDKLLVKEMDVLGNCGVECKTIQRAAEEIMGEHDTDIAETLFTGKKNRAQFTNWLCYELTAVCKAKPPPLPKDRAPGPAFQPQQEGDQNLDRMLGEMQDQGMRGSLYSREELLAKYGMPEGHQDDDDEEDDEDRGPLETYTIAGGPRPPTPALSMKEKIAEHAREATAAATKGFQSASEAGRAGFQVASQGVQAVKEKAWGLWNKFVRRQEQQQQEL